ncbi:MAG: hypothetical protein AAFN04_11530 [Pseudomonadota bacterium]
MRLAAAILGALALSVSGWALAQDSEAGEIELIVSGPPIEANETGQPYLYRNPRNLSTSGGSRAQAWSMLGREDLSAGADDEYDPSPCSALAPLTQGENAVLARIVDRAKDHRVVVINESHTVTRHRDFSRQVIAALRQHSFDVLAAETFSNAEEEPDPVDQHADKPYIHIYEGYYSREPVFAAMLREAKARGYRFAAYEQVYGSTRDREAEQAERLAAVLETMPLEQKLIVHVGYGHATENKRMTADGQDVSRMAARLKRDHGFDPLTIAQTQCRGSADSVQLSQPPERVMGWFDLIVDHPVHGFRHGRSDWRFTAGARAVDIPEPYASAHETLIIEVFAEGEPFEAVPVDRVWVDPGEDVKLALKPGRYTVRAVRPATLPERD